MMSLNTGVVVLSGVGNQQILPVNAARKRVLLNSVDKSFVGASGFTSGYRTDSGSVTELTDTDSIWANGVSGNKIFFVEESVVSSGAAGCPCVPNLPIVQTYGPGNWTWFKPSGASKVRVIVVGGGGGGGGGSVGAPPMALAAGGGGGGWSTAEYDASDLSSTENIIVGVGGNAGFGGNGDGVGGFAGTAGGDTIFGTSVNLLAGGGQPGSGAFLNISATGTSPGGSG